MAKELTVAEANQRDVGRSVARIPSEAIDDLGIVPGDSISTTKEDTDADS